MPSRVSLSTFLTALSLLPLAYAEPQSEPAQPDPLAAIRLAIHEQQPKIAVTKAKRLLSQEKISSEVATQARILMAEAAVRAGDIATALEATQDETQAEAVYWRASALQKADRYTESLRWWGPLKLPADSPMAASAVLNQAACLAAIGRNQEALNLLKSTTATDTRIQLWTVELLQRLGKHIEARELLSQPAPTGKEAAWSYLLGRTELGSQKFAAATLAFSKSLSQVTPLLKPTVTLGLAESLRQEKRTPEAVKLLTAFIEESPKSPWLGSAFESLIRCNAQAPEEVGLLISAWEKSPQPTLAEQAAYAALEIKAATGTTKEILEGYVSFGQRFPNSLLTPRVVIQKVSLLIREKRLPEAKAVLESLKIEAFPPAFQTLRRELDGYLAFAQGEFSQAAATFQALGEAALGPEEKLRSSYNQALASLLGDQPEAASFAIIQPNGDDPTTLASKPWLGSLLLEKAMQAAADGDEDTANTDFRRFLAEHPGHPREFQARLALAELFPDDAGLTNAAVMAASTPEEKKAATLLSLELQSKGPLPAYLANLTKFLSTQPESLQHAQLLFHSGEACYHNQQFVTAKVQFAKAANMAAEAPLAQAAHYWAGKAAMGSMTTGSDSEALLHWEAAAKTKGPFRHRAKLEQAILEQRRAMPVAALQVLESILKDSPPPEAETRYAVLCLRSEMLASLQKPTEAQLNEAIALCDSVIAAQGASVTWRQQASFRRATVLELQKHIPEALEAYHATMSPPISPVPIVEATHYHWFLRAGEKALAILESQQDWKSAIAMAQKMSQAPGPLADAARAKAERLKTQHLIWDDENGN